MTIPADLFTAYERLQTCHRVEVTLDNLHLIAQHFNGTAVYTEDPTAKYPSERKSHVLIPQTSSGVPSRAEVGSWIDKRGSRWNPEPITQGWSPAGTYQEVNAKEKEDE